MWAGDLVFQHLDAVGVEALVDLERLDREPFVKSLAYAKVEFTGVGFADRRCRQGRTVFFVDANPLIDNPTQLRIDFGFVFAVNSAEGEAWRPADVAAVFLLLFFI